MTLSQLQSRSLYWQARLNLREWSISTRWISDTKKAEKVWGRSWWSSEELRATVEINKCDKHKEETLVHELLHIVLEGHKDLERDHEIPLERAINRIAAALTEVGS